MTSGLTSFALGIVGLTAAAAMVAQAPAPNDAAPGTIPIATQETKPPKPAPQPGGMISHSISPAPVVISQSMRQPPIVAIPRIPGPADMMAPVGNMDLRTIQSFPSNEACDEALYAVRQTISDAFCVSTTPPPAPPEHGYLIEVNVESNEWVGLETYATMAACERALAARAGKPGVQAACTPKLH